MRPTSLTILSLLLLTFSFAAYAQDDEAEIVNFEIFNNEEGLIYAESAYDLDETTERLTTALEENENIRLLGVVNHTENAESVDLDLPPIRLILFGNPNLGTPLMQAERTVALDLPQKLLVWEDEGTVFVGYNSPFYLAARHGIDLETEALATIDNALANLAASVTDGDAMNYTAMTQPDEMPVTEMQDKGFVVVESANDFETTVTQFTDALEANDFIVPFTVDHSANAESVDLELLPTTLVIFGNPSAGTPLMQLESTLAIDLPQKMLVWENAEGVVSVAYNDPLYLMKRHGIDDVPEAVGNISDALAMLAEAATTATE